MKGTRALESGSHTFVGTPSNIQGINCVTMGKFPKQTEPQSPHE